MLDPSKASLGCLLLLLSTASAASSNVWDYAPDFSADAIQPYPDLKYRNGSDITVENLRGARLFGYKGCTGERGKLIKQAFNDFYTLANQLQVYNNIDWNAQASTDFWGPASGPNQIPDNTRTEIAQIFKAAQQVYSYWWTWQPPWLSWRQLWIEVRCSDGETGPDSSDPDDFCGDYDPNKGKCPSGNPPVGGGKVTLEAFSDPNPSDSRYSRITFCNDFFKLQTFKVAVENAKALPATQQLNLENWNNQARCMFHEITHLDYFMNAGDDSKALSPYVSDLEVYYRDRGIDDWHDAYGPYNARILRNWVDPDPQYSGYFTQRNADSYAYFALAKYVESQIGRYPAAPSPGRRKPKQEPRDAKTHGPPAAAGLSSTSLDTDLIDGDEQDPPDDVSYPGCGDQVGTDIPAASISASISSEYAGPTSTSNLTSTLTPTPTSSASAIPDPDCADTALAFPQPPVADFIDSFCSNKAYWDVVLTGPESYGTGLTDDGRGKASGASDSYALDGSTDKLWLATMYSRDSCQGFAAFTEGTTDDEKLEYCKVRFSTILNGCQTDTITDKLGGTLQDVCVVYTITRQPDGDDPFDDWFSNLGDFTCEDTDVSAIGGDSSPLKGTCTCWYSGYPGLTDVFNMPDSGDCKDTNKADLYYND